MIRPNTTAQASDVTSTDAGNPISPPDDQLARQEQATEIATAFADLPDALRAHPGVKRLYRAAVGALGVQRTFADKTGTFECGTFAGHFAMAAAGANGCGLSGSGECDCTGMCQRVKDGYAAAGVNPCDGSNP